MSSDHVTQEKGQGTRPEADGPGQAQPPAKPEPAPQSPEKTPDVHGDPETPA